MKKEYLTPDNRTLDVSTYCMQAVITQSTQENGGMQIKPARRLGPTSL